LGHSASTVMFKFPVLDSPAKAVDIFMVVSGFLMMFHYRLRAGRDPWDSPATWRKFWVRRLLRIAPLYYILLVISILGYGYFRDEQATFTGGMASMHPAARALEDDVLHFTFLFGLFPNHCATMPIPDWSISLEMQFYAIFPFLALATKRIGLISSGAIAGLVTVVSVNLLWEVYGLGPPKLLGSFPQPSLILLKAGFFLCGMMAAEAMELKRTNTGNAARVALASFLLAAVLSGKLVTAIVGLIVLLSFSQSGFASPRLDRTLRVVRGFLCSKASRFLASRSYSVYLAHTLVLFSTGMQLNRLRWFEQAPPILRFAALSAACAAVLAPITWVLHHAVESPGIALGKRLTERRPSDVLRVSASAGL